MSQLFVATCVALVLVSWQGVVSATPLEVETRTEQQVLISTSNASVSFDVSAGARRAMPLDRQLISMSIEFCYAVDFLGTPGSPNVYSKQLLQNIQDKSGVPPILRIGGNTQDIAKFCENCPEAMNSTFKSGNSEAVNVTYSKGLFEVMNENGPSNQKYIFGLNLGQDNVEIPKAELAGALKYLDQSKLIAYELGNEPDHYIWPQVNYRSPATWTMAAYVKQTLDWLPQLASGKRFQYGSSAADPATVSDFTMVQAVKWGISKIKQIKIISSHAYMGNRCTPTNEALLSLETYVNHMLTVQYFSSYVGEIAAAKSIGATYHMGETNTVACHGKEGLSNTMGALLWMIDYSFYLATLGADRLFFHNGKGDFFYSMWEPGALNESYPAHINPQYYSMLFTADVVSNIRNPSIHRVASLDTYDLAHYAIYSGSRLQKMVILNTHFHNGTAKLRPVKYVDLSPVLGKNIQVKRLTSANTIAKNGTTWGGQYVDGVGKLVGNETWEGIEGGVVRMYASEAVIVQRGGK
ncbi:glycoside hydrolase superfamily [Cadophora sp. MPI-SDFR-AT-0126]|nr:glycoside hydrolase superfamily [Leotiomycetes sp. MPI-SDFR-AT-0126]